MNNCTYIANYIHVHKEKALPLFIQLKETRGKGLTNVSTNFKKIGSNRREGEGWFSFNVFTERTSRRERKPPSFPHPFARARL